MSSNWSIDTEEGKVWYVGAYCIFGDKKRGREGEVIIPIDQIDGLSAEQIGQTVLDSVPIAEACYVSHLAYDYADAAKEDNYKRASDEDVQSWIVEDLPLLERYKDSRHTSNHRADFESAITYLYTLRERLLIRLASKGKRKSSNRQARAVVSRSHSAIFIRIGERDGFLCGSCGTTKSLRIDHIKPVSQGGDSGDNNLQLLCAPCNSRKGTKTIDYRKASADEAQIQAEPDIHAEQSALSEDMPGVSN